jgi:hypothetical protein
VLDMARERQIDVKPISFVSARPAEDICNVARAKASDLVLLGWREPVLGASVLGKTPSQVMRKVPGDVAILVDRGLRNVERVLVPTHRKRPDSGALAVGRRLRAAGKQVVLVECDEARFVDTILAESLQHYDLVVVDVAGGTSGLERLMREVPTSLLLVRGSVPVRGLAGAVVETAAVPA